MCSSDLQRELEAAQLAHSASAWKAPDGGAGFYAFSGFPGAAGLSEPERDALHRVTQQLSGGEPLVAGVLSRLLQQPAGLPGGGPFAHLGAGAAQATSPGLPGLSRESSVPQGAAAAAGAAEATKKDRKPRKARSRSRGTDAGSEAPGDARAGAEIGRAHV